MYFRIVALNLMQNGIRYTIHIAWFLDLIGVLRRIQGYFAYTTVENILMEGNPTPIQTVGVEDSVWWTSTHRESH